MTQIGTPITRRTLLQMSCGAVAVAGFPTIPVSGSWPRSLSGRFGLDEVQADTFLRYLGRTLMFRGSQAPQSSPTELTLVKVTRHSKPAGIESRGLTIQEMRPREPFSLLFEKKNDRPLGPGLQRLEHPDFENFELLLSRVGRPSPDGAICFEAVFG